jgi:hypothetical protein
MAKIDRFKMTARGPGGQHRAVAFTMAADDQRSVTSVGCAVLARKTKVDGWTPLTVVWTNRPEAQA